MLKPEQCVLLVVDVQGQLAQVVQQSQQLHKKLITLIKGVQLFDIPVICLEQLPDKLGATSVEVAQSIEQFNPINKHHFSGWQAEALQQQLAVLGRKHIILAGIETHVCVYQTCRQLLDNGFQPHLVTDAVSSRELANKLSGIEMMLYFGAIQTNVETLLFELQQDAQGDRFKALLTLIK